MEKVWTKCRPTQENMRTVLADQLRKATPNQHSIDEKARWIAAIISQEVDVNWKTCRNWLNGDHLPHIKYLPALAALLGAELIFRLVFGDDT
ncbi:MAG: hypothetical protein AAGI09_11975 [Pseudomonadota bacterium]